MSVLEDLRDFWSSHWKGAHCIFDQVGRLAFWKCIAKPIQSVLLLGATGQMCRIWGNSGVKGGQISLRFGMLKGIKGTFMKRGKDMRLKVQSGFL